jgi:nicotinamidase-related amidase
MRIAESAALVLVDLQRAIDDPSWGVRNHPDAESRGARLVAAWRRSGRAVFHVKHDSVEPHSTYRPGQPGNEFKPEFLPCAGERVIVKHTGSAFVGTGLQSLLEAGGHSQLVLFGVITNNSVETTVRHAACQGFRVVLVEDACFTFGRMGWSADEIHAMSLANLEGEYCEVTTADAVLLPLNRAGGLMREIVEDGADPILGE